MKKMIFAGIAAIVFSCSMGVASAYSYNQEQAAKKAAQAKECTCSGCSCDDCQCQNCSQGNCSESCVKNAGCSGECTKK